MKLRRLLCFSRCPASTEPATPVRDVDAKALPEARQSKKCQARQRQSRTPTRKHARETDDGFECWSRFGIVPVGAEAPAQPITLLKECRGKTHYARRREQARRDVRETMRQWDYWFRWAK